MNNDGKEAVVRGEVFPGGARPGRPQRGVAQTAVIDQVEQLCNIDLWNRYCSTTWMVEAAAGSSRQQKAQPRRLTFQRCTPHAVDLRRRRGIRIRVGGTRAMPGA